MTHRQPVILGEMPSLSKLYVNAAARRRAAGSWERTTRRTARRQP